jgi:hypothetical protein
MELSVSYTFSLSRRAGSEADFDRDVWQNILDDVERQLVGEFDPLVFQAVQEAHDTLRAYGASHDYDVESVIESFAGVEVDRTPSSITVTYGWDHPAAEYFEFGTSNHTVDGDPVLVFEFDAEEYPYLKEMFPEGTAFLPQTEPSGLPEARFARDSQHWLRRAVT